MKLNITICFSKIERRVGGTGVKASTLLLDR
jgi:hypothetical protein